MGCINNLRMRAKDYVMSGLSTFQSRKPLEELQPDINRAVESLQSCDDFTTKQASRNFRTLFDIGGAGSIICDNNHDLGAYLVENGYGALFPKMWNALKEYTSKDRWNTQGFSNLAHMLSSYMNVTDVSPELGAELMRLEASTSLFAALKDLDQDDKSAYDLINPILGILQNIIRVNSFYRMHYRNDNGVAILKRFLDSSNMELKTDSLLTLAYIVDETDNKFLGDRGVVGILVSLLKSAVKSSRHEAFVKSGCYSALELLDGLNRLAVNDDNKKVIEKEGAIPAITRMLQSGFSEKDQQTAAEALWNLAFVESIRQRCLQQPEITKCLERLVESDNESLRCACASALWQIKGADPSANISGVSQDPPSYKEAIKEGATSTSDSAQVMISYQWDSQTRVLEIRDRLAAAGYKIWMDITNMKGDILTAMAKGVENSTAVLICMSEKYKESRSCRSEATYAYKLGKPMIPLLLESGYQPDGWLGILQGMDIYYEFHSSDHLEPNMMKLLKAIEECMGNDMVDGTIKPTQQEDVCTAAKPENEDKNTEKAEPLPTPPSDWTTDDVQDWLKEINLHELCSTLDFCDGNHLEMLYSQHCQNPKEFKDDMKSEYQMSAKTHLQFTVALKKLFKK